MSSVLVCVILLSFLQLEREDRLRRGLTVSDDDENLKLLLNVGFLVITALRGKGAKLSKCSCVHVVLPLVTVWDLKWS